MSRSIGVLGAGTIGVGIGRFYAKAGWEVLISNTRGPDTLADAVRSVGGGARAVTAEQAAGQDVVLLAIPWGAVEAVLKATPQWNGRVIVDATNAIRRYEPPIVETVEFGDSTSSEQVAAWARGARVVKAFNNLPYAQVVAPTGSPGRRVMFVSGDDQGAKDDVRSVLEVNGLAVVDLGTLAAGARLQQVGGPLASLDLRLVEN